MSTPAEPLIDGRNSEDLRVLVLGSHPLDADTLRGVVPAGTRERRLRQGAVVPRCAGHAREALTASWRHAVR